MEPHSVCLHVSGLFYSAECFQGSSMLYHVSGLHSFVQPNNVPSCVYINIHRPRCVHSSSFGGHLGCCHLLATVTHIVMNLNVQVSVSVPAFSSLGHPPGSVIVVVH